MRPIWCLPDPLQRERSQILDSLAASDEVLTLEYDDRHPTLLQKPPTSTQPTPTVALAPVPPLASSSMAPLPLFLTLLPTPRLTARKQ